jgi:serine/threonine-protein kinase
MQHTRPFPEHEALRIVSQVCDALQYLHEHQIVHRDLKPQNIMLCNDGSLRIMDFGIAKAGASRRLTFGGFSPTMGTPDYMAPEQVKGQRGDERTDLYSLGAILYEMVTGHVPFEGPNAFAVMNARLVGDPPAPRSYNPDLQQQVEEIVLHAMTREPDNRYPSATAMKADLDHPDDVVVTGRVTRLTLPTQWKNRWRTVRIVVITALAPILLFLLLWLLMSRR